MRIAGIALLLQISLFQQDPKVRPQDDPPGRVVPFTPDGAPLLAAPLSDAARHFSLVLSFPEPVTRAIVPWNEEDLSIDTDGAEVMLKLLKAVEGDIAFRGRSGRLYRFHLKPAGEGPADRYVRVVLPEEPRERREGAREKAGALELIRAMRCGAALQEAKVSAVKEEPLFEAEAVVFKPRLVYTTARHRGYVIELENRSKTIPYRIDLARFAARDLLLAGARDLLVAPGASTRLYFVFWK